MVHSSPRAADEWFRTLEETIHSPVFSTSQCHQRIRIAIVGEGIDPSHPEIRKALEEQMIIECQGFPETLEPLHDSQGYGTYCVSITLRTIPWVSVYIARVVNDEGYLVEDDDYLATARVTILLIKLPLTRLGHRMGNRKESGHHFHPMGN